jgi:hypothetical protein
MYVLQLVRDQCALACRLHESAGTLTGILPADIAIGAMHVEDSERYTLVGARDNCFERYLRTWGSCWPETT